MESSAARSSPTFRVQEVKMYEIIYDYEDEKNIQEALDYFSRFICKKKREAKLTSLA